VSKAYHTHTTVQVTIRSGNGFHVTIDDACHVALTVDSTSSPRGRRQAIENQFK